MHDVDYAFEAEWQAPQPHLKLAPVLVTPPAAYPVNLAQAKSQCRVDHTDDDADIQSYLDAAIEHLDGYGGILGRALVNQTWRQDFAGFCDVMRLPLAPLVSITSVTYYDADNALQTLSAATYTSYTDARGPVIALNYGQTWPAVYPRPNAVSVTFVAGYGAAATDVPSRIRNAIRIHVEQMYRTRGVDTAEQRYPTMTYERLIKPFERVYSS